MQRSEEGIDLKGLRILNSGIPEIHLRILFLFYVLCVAKSILVLHKIWYAYHNLFRHL